MEKNQYSTKITFDEKRTPPPPPLLTNPLTWFLVIDCVVAAAEAIVVFEKAPYAGYIIFIAGSLPRLLYYFYDEIFNKLVVTVKEGSTAKQGETRYFVYLKMAFYLISYPLVTTLATFPFRILPFILNAFVHLLDVKKLWMGYKVLFVVVLLIGPLLTMGILIHQAPNPREAVMLTYGISIVLLFLVEFYSLTQIEQQQQKKNDDFNYTKRYDLYLVFFMEGVVYWLVVIPLFYTQQGAYIGVFFFSSLYHLYVLANIPTRNPAKEGGGGLQKRDYRNLVLFCNNFWKSLILTFFLVVGAFLVFTGILYGFELERRLNWSLF